MGTEIGAVTEFSCTLCMVCMQVSSQWPKELEAKQSRLAAVQATLNNGINTEVCTAVLWTQ